MRPRREVIQAASCRRLSCKPQIVEKCRIIEMTNRGKKSKQLLVLFAISVLFLIHGGANQLQAQTFHMFPP